MLALVLAGDSKKNRIELAGRPMVWHVVQALSQCRSIHAVKVAASQADWDYFTLSGSAERIDSGQTLFETLQAVFRSDLGTEKVLLVTADIPLVTADAIEHFLACCSNQKADLYYPVISKKNQLASFPGCKRTFVRFREGSFTGGNIFLLSPRIVHEVLEKSESFLLYRKKPWHLSRLLGWSFLVQLCLGRLRIRQIEQRAWELFHIRGKAVETPYAELGFDVDKPSDLALIRPYMSLKL